MMPGLGHRSQSRWGGSVRVSVVFAVLAASCATLANGHAGLDDPPSARVGPFRLLKPGEIGANHPAPDAINDSQRFLRDPSVVHAPAGGFAVTAFFAGVANGAAPTDPTDRIVAYDAVDGRSFPGLGVEVLVSAQPWEGGHVGAPSAVVVGGETWLYYEGSGGIGLAKPKGDGTFTSTPEPVWTAAGVAWAEGAIARSPGVAVLPDGSFRMFYEVEVGGVRMVGEARSSDGASWEPVGEGPAIASGGAGSPDERGAGSPSPVLATSSEGREILDVYYTADGASGAAVALAARYVDAGDDDAPLERSPSLMLVPSKTLAVREPCVVRFDTFTLLFATENASKTSTDPVVVVGLAPATEALPPADPR